VSERGSIQAEAGRRIQMLLAAYTAGTLSEPFAVLVASHLQMKGADRISAVPSLRLLAMDQMGALMPLALRHYASRHLHGTLPWRTFLPGLRECLIARDGQAVARFLHCRPGKAIPAHTHTGLEAALVLQGGFVDATGHYGRGDIAVADDTVDHRPVGDRSGDCIIFMVLEAPVTLTGPFGRVLQRILPGSG
jgi:putative transcriptional regulator